MISKNEFLFHYFIVVKLAKFYLHHWTSEVFYPGICEHFHP